MIQHRVGQCILGATMAICVAICMLTGAGCRKGDSDAKGEGQSATAASDASCEQFVTKLCARSGDKSPLCASGKNLGKILPKSACAAAIADFAQVEQQIDADRKVCTDLMERLCAKLGETTDACKRVREQTPQFPREQCEELSKNFDSLVQELESQEAQMRPLAPEAQARIAASGAPSFGPENAKVTIVEFSDFECPFCSRAADVVHQIRKAYGDRVRFVFRQFPLPSHSSAHLAAQASLAAAEQGKFWEYHDLLFANQRSLGRDSLEAYAKQVGLNVPRLEKALDAQTYKAAVDRDVSLGEGVNVNGTPTLFINGKRVPNPTDFAAVAQLIDQALAA